MLFLPSKQDFFPTGLPSTLKVSGAPGYTTEASESIRYAPPCALRCGSGSGSSVGRLRRVEQSNAAVNGRG